MKKRTISFVLALILCLSLLPAGGMTASAATYKTSFADDYRPGTILEIYTVDDLLTFADMLETDRSIDARLMADLDLDEKVGHIWNAMAGYGPDNGYTGTFDGNGHAIMNLYGESFFNTIAAGGVVRDLSLMGVTVTSGGATLAYMSYGKVENCHAVGMIEVENCMYIGGLVARVEGGGAVLNCTTSVDITAGATETGYLNFGYYEVGGIAGFLDGCIDGCTSFGNITLSGYVPGCGITVGGVAGFQTFGDPVMRNSGNFGSISLDVQAGAERAPGPLDVGGVVGSVYSDEPVKNCFNTGDVTVNMTGGTIHAGGVDGNHYYYQKFENCWSSGTVSVSSDEALASFRENESSTNYFMGADAAVGSRDGQYFTQTELTDGTLLAKLNAYVAADSSGTLFEWTQEAEGPLTVGTAYWLPFTDVKHTDYFFHPVIWAVDYEVTTGTSATAFTPGSLCTQAQILTFLWRAAGEPEPWSYENPYPDLLNESMYYYKPVLWAYHSYMIADPNFDPSRECTRFEAVYYIWNVAGCPDATSPSPFTDVEDDFLANIVSWAVEAGVTTGTSATKFSPENTCTRGQIVTFLHRFFSQLPEDHHIFW